MDEKYVCERERDQFDTATIEDHANYAYSRPPMGLVS